MLSMSNVSSTGRDRLGFSVQKHHIDKLPTIKGPLKTKRRFLVSGLY